MTRTTQAGALLIVCLGAAPAFADATSDARAVDEQFARAVNARDVAAATAFYADDATAIYTGDGDEAKGKAEIEKMIAALTKSAKELKLVFHDNRAFALDDSHLMNLNHWDFSVTGTDGKRTSVRGRSSELMVKGTDGLWRFLVDHASVGVPPPPAPPVKPRGKK